MFLPSEIFHVLARPLIRIFTYSSNQDSTKNKASKPRKNRLKVFNIYFVSGSSDLTLLLNPPQRLKLTDYIRKAGSNLRETRGKSVEVWSKNFIRETFTDQSNSTTQTRDSCHRTSGHSWTNSNKKWAQTQKKWHATSPAHTQQGISFIEDILMGNSKLQIR